jgi:predicted transcriptional regulator
MARNPFVAVRVSPEIIKSLDEIASERGITRSALVKELLANCHSFHRFIESERAKQQSDKVVLDGNLSKWIMNNMQENMTPEWLHFIGEVMHHVADEIKEEKEKESETPAAGPE